MPHQIVPEPASCLADYARIPISFEVTHELIAGPPATALDAKAFRVRPVDKPYVKDYDSIEGCRPTDWPGRWDLSRWWIGACYFGDERVGGAAVAFDTPGLEMLAGGRDVAVLWDIRVRPDFRRRGVGGGLFRAAEAWARGEGCRRLVVETQTTNVPACRFYASQGCVLVSVESDAYPDFPDEARLLWRKDLGER